MAQDKEAQQALMRALLPYIVFEMFCVVAGVAAQIVTGEVLWTILGALVGGAPMVWALLRYTKNPGKR